MNIATFAARFSAACLLFALAACGGGGRGDSKGIDSEGIMRWWSFYDVDRPSIGLERIGDERFKVGGSASERLAVGSLVLFPPGNGPDADVEVFAGDSGRTFWVSAEAPSANPAGGGAPFGSSTELLQYQHFRKTAQNASLRLVVSKVVLEAIDNNGGLPTAIECPWHDPTASYEDCRRVMRAAVSFAVTATMHDDGRVLVKTGGTVELTGWNDTWDSRAFTSGDATARFWSDASFVLDPNVDGTFGERASVTLASPVVVDVPLASVPMDGQFFVVAEAKAVAINRRQRESYLSAYLRDPSSSDGLSVELVGVEPIPAPPVKPTPTAPVPAAECTTGTDPAAGRLELAQAAFAAPESPGAGATIIVTRTGGSSGAVSATLTTADGTAIAGADYVPVKTEVLFADGESGSRFVDIPLVLDDAAEADETLTVTLSAPRGCASLGTTSSATVTLLDDDRPIQTGESFSVGGTVTGLDGSGLVLTNNGLDMSVAANGEFTFVRPLSDGLPYDVRVKTQPINPNQICTVARGSGTIAGADVTDVAVDCTTPAANGALDASFGSGGKVFSTLLAIAGTSCAMALAPDGKIVVAGTKSGDLAVARFNGDGSVDTSFGTGGVATADIAGSSDEGRAVAIQPDGRIVVVGLADVATVGVMHDFALARFNIDGSLDASFGNGGKVSTDFAGRTDQAQVVVIQPDGKIVVAGSAITGTDIRGQPENDFALARYTADGSPDASFGSGGKVTTNIAGGVDFARAIALQPDGRIVVAGGVGVGSSRSVDHTGVARYNADGTLDAVFGSGGKTTLALIGGHDLVLQGDGKLLLAGSVGSALASRNDLALMRLNAAGGLDFIVQTDFAATDDNARSLALQADGRIVVAGSRFDIAQPATVGIDFALARYNGDGSLDATFGSDGKLGVDFFGASDTALSVAIQPDGRIVAAGSARNGTSIGIGLVRLVP